MAKQQLTLCTAGGEMHGLINTLTNCVPADEFKHFKPEHKKEMEAQKKENARTVKAEYLNSRGRHERLTKPFCLGSGEPIQIWHFIPGKTYEVPLGLIKEVNDKNKILPKRSGLISVDGENIQKTGAPLDVDQEGDYLHRFVAAGF